jgi:hypothetical protein
MGKRLRSPADGIEIGLLLRETRAAQDSFYSLGVPCGIRMLSAEPFGIAVAEMVKAGAIYVYFTRWRANRSG